MIFGLFQLLVLIIDAEDRLFCEWIKLVDYVHCVRIISNYHAIHHTRDKYETNNKRDRVDTALHVVGRQCHSFRMSRHVMRRDDTCISPSQRFHIYLISLVGSNSIKKMIGRHISVSKWTTPILDDVIMNQSM